MRFFFAESRAPWERRAPARHRKAMTPNPEWYSRGYLPHRDTLDRLQSITFRLADSLPQEVLKKLEVELENLPDDQKEIVRRKEIER